MIGAFCGNMWDPLNIQGTSDASCLMSEEEIILQAARLFLKSLTDCTMALVEISVWLEAYE